MHKLVRVGVSTALAVTMLAGVAKCGEPCEKTKDKGTPPGSGRQVCDDTKSASPAWLVRR